MTSPDFAAAMTEEHATVLVRLDRSTHVKGGYLTRREVGLADLDFAPRALEQLRRDGLVEDRALGERSRGWRLTDAGRAALPAARAALEDAEAERRLRWERDNLVYGVARPAEAGPLSQRQQRAWMRGFVSACLPGLPLPADAPAEVRANLPELLGWMTRQLEPYNPLVRPPAIAAAPSQEPPAPVVAPKPSGPKP